MSWLNLILAALAALFWGGAVLWMYHRDIRKTWLAYRRRWTAD